VPTTPAPRFAPFVALAFGCVLAASSATAQQLRDLPKPSREIADPFSLVLNATEYRPGQVLVADGADMEVSLVDFATGTRRVLGRKGAGPGEYTVPVGVLRLPGDTIVVLDGGGGGAVRIVKFLPSLAPSTTTTMMLFNTADSTVVQGTIFADARGNIYSTSLKLVAGPTGITPADSMRVVRFDLRQDTRFTTMASIRTPQSGAQQRQQDGTNIRVRTPFSGLVTADAWTVFSDGTIAIIRGAGYTIEFLAPGGQRTPPVAIPYNRIPVAAADRNAELEAQRKQLADAMAVIKKTLPPNVNLDVDIIPPPSWPSEYPPVAAIVAYPAPSGHIWVRRSVPARIGREQWDVIDRTGKLTARWQLPPQTALVGVGAGVVYTVRTDEDDLRYLQRVEIPR
jgi:hypothetical protein